MNRKNEKTEKERKKTYHFNNWYIINRVTIDGCGPQDLHFVHFIFGSHYDLVPACTSSTLGVVGRRGSGWSAVQCIDGRAVGISCARVVFGSLHIA